MRLCLVITGVGICAFHKTLVIRVDKFSICNSLDDHFFGGQEQVFVMLTNGNWLFMPYLTALLGVIM